MANPRITLDASPKDYPFGTDFFFRLEIEIESFGSPEVIPPYNRPDLYDPGCGAEWSVVGLELYHDRAGEPFKVGIDDELREHLIEFAEREERIKERVEEAIAECREDA